MKIILFCCVLTMLSACSGGNDAANQTSTNPNKGSSNQFKVAAITKIRAANPTLSSQQATCVVDQMTAGGQIGLGEINQMKLTAGQLDKNRNSLTQAYQSAIKQCQ